MAFKPDQLSNLVLSDSGIKETLSRKTAWPLGIMSCYKSKKGMWWREMDLNATTVYVWKERGVKQVPAKTRLH